MKVLILHQHFKIPQLGGAIRSYFLAKALVERGVEVIVITGHGEGSYRHEMLEGIEVHYLSVPYNNRFGFTRRIYSFFQFVFKATRLAARYRDSDVCYAISTPLTTGLVAKTIRSKYNIPYIFEVGDLWPEAPIEMGFIRNRFLQRLAYWMEEAIYQSASSLVALSPAIGDVLQKKNPAKPIHLIPNMSDTDFFRPGEKQPALELKFNVEGKFVISYIGAMGIANGLFYLLDCAKACAREQLSVHFLLCGDGAMLEELQKSANESHLHNVSFIPFQSRDGVAEVMNVTDAAFVSYLPVRVLETGSPNKYFDALAAGKLIIINFGGWIRKEIEQEVCGVYIDPGKPGEVVHKLKPFLSDDAELKKYQLASRALAERKYSRAILSERFYTIFEGRNHHSA